MRKRRRRRSPVRIRYFRRVDKRWRRISLMPDIIVLRWWWSGRAGGVMIYMAIGDLEERKRGSFEN